MGGETRVQISAPDQGHTLPDQLPPVLGRDVSEDAEQKQGRKLGDKQPMERNTVLESNVNMFRIFVRG